MPTLVCEGEHACVCVCVTMCVCDGAHAYVCVTVCVCEGGHVCVHACALEGKGCHTGHFFNMATIQVETTMKKNHEKGTFINCHEHV